VHTRLIADLDRNAGAVVSVRPSSAAYHTRSAFFNGSSAPIPPAGLFRLCGPCASGPRVTEQQTSPAAHVHDIGLALGQKQF
jgi:hypothetical protein